MAGFTDEAPDHGCLGRVEVPVRERSQHCQSFTKMRLHRRFLAPFVIRRRSWGRQSTRRRPANCYRSEQTFGLVGGVSKKSQRLAVRTEGRIVFRRFIRFMSEDSYPIGFLSGIIIARSFWFPWWDTGRPFTHSPCSPWRRSPHLESLPEWRPRSVTLERRVSRTWRDIPGRPSQRTTLPTQPSRQQGGSVRRYPSLPPPASGVTWPIHGSLR